MIGPISRNNLILCSADASPNAQRGEADRAKTFFYRAPWVVPLEIELKNSDVNSLC